MGAPIFINDGLDLWVSNREKDLFCEIVVAVSDLFGRDISDALEVAPGIAGTYGVSGLGIEIEGFYSYFGGRHGFRQHLDVCSARIDDVCDRDRPGRASMERILVWVKHLMDGGTVKAEMDIYSEWPPVTSSKLP